MKTMKKPTIFKVFIAAVFLLLCASSHAQVRQSFSTRKTTSLNGDILVIGNNILNRDNDRNNQRPNNPYNTIGSGSSVNDELNMKYIDIDNDNNTFNSSSAKLTIPQASQTCYEIVYAALYWGGTYQGNSRGNINKVKLKTPGANAKYKEITGSLIWDEGASGVSNAYVSKPYACFADITSDVIAAQQGNYTVADITCSEGKLDNGRGGQSGGWTIFVIYKDPLLPNKYITSFDGFGIIRASDNPLDIPISGFRTNPFGDVNVKLAFSALEGDNRLKGDGLQIKGTGSSTWGNISSLTRPIEVSGWLNPTYTPNFFNSSITDGDSVMMDREPNSINTLGYDAGVVKVDNNNNEIIKNDETSATLKISTSSDSYYMFFTAMSVEIIAPKIVLKKNALDKDGKNINGQPVSLNQDIQYEINFRNEGNDNAKNFTITDELPKNVIFGGLSGITMDSRITATYDNATRKLVFTIPDAMVVANGPLTPYSIKFKVKVVDDCNELIDACANRIENIAYSKYFGVKNTTPEGFGEGSYSSISQCNIGEPTATNFLVGIQDCLFSRDVSICGTATLTAALGYKTYVWRDPNGVIFGGNNRTVTIDKPGKYTVNNSGAENCEPIQQTFNVKDYLAGTIQNPIKGDNIDPATGLAYACVRDNKPFPKIFLCGLNDKREIDTQITGATKVTWQETKDVPPANQPNPESCPYEGATNWTTVVENNTKFTADRAGVFRLVVNYGNTCVVTHYFNVYQNNLDPKAEKQDIVCNTKGRITVTNPPQNTGYVYSLDGTNYQPESTFNNVPKGSYKVQIRQSVLIDGQMSTCPFFVDVNVEELVLTTDVKATHPICTGDLGTVSANINNVPGQYRFVLRKKGSNVEIQNTGLIDDNFTLFKGVEPGVYEVVMTTANNGCSQIKEIEVFDYRLSAQAKVTKSLSACSDGEIQITVTGGTPRTGPPPYYMYYINNNPVFVTTPTLVVTKDNIPADGIFNIVVVDDKGCSVKIPPITMTQVAKPTVVINTKNLSCYNVNEGEISMTVTPANSGYAVAYNVNGGAYTTLPTTNLKTGKYKVIVRYTYDDVECFDPEKEVAITGPSDRLTASGGVAELSGCGPTDENQGLLRITNPQGGVPFPAPNLYRYSFDDQKTWITSNQQWVDPRATPYTLYIKDAAGCIFSIPGIVLESKPTKPDFKVTNPVYNCKGEGTSTVTVTTDPNTTYTYKYFIGKPDPANSGSYIYTENTNVPSNIFKDIPVGDYKIKVEYNLASAPTFSNLLSEDFGNGDDTTSPGINNVYCFERQDNIVDCNKFNAWHPWLMNDGEYTVTKGILPDHGPDFGWVIPKDHTNAPGITDGRYLAINIGGVTEGIPVGTIIYSKPIHDVIPKQDVKVTFYALNLLKSTNLKAAPDLTIELSKNGVAVPGASVKTAKITQNEQWNKIELAINPGDNTDLDFVIKTNIAIVDGSDLAIDDILVYQLPKSCLSAEVLNLKVEPGKAFDAIVEGVNGIKCKGDKNGTFSIVAKNFDPATGFYYTLNGSATNPTWVNSMTSPVNFTDKGEGVYDIRVRYANDAASCNFTIPTEIKSPPALIVTAAATAATCKGATVTASVVGGTPGYVVTLKDKNSTFTKTFPTTDWQLEEIPAGTYIISGTDANGCTDDMDTELVIDKAPEPKATIVSNVGLCFDGSNATIRVSISGGLKPYSYQVSTDGGLTYGSSSATFDGPTFDYTATATGTYQFLITDKNGCGATTASQKINDKITADADITKVLSCVTGSADATIQVKINGGTGPYTYTVKKKGTTDILYNSGAIAGPLFTYSASTAGIYVFDIKDVNNCPFSVEKEVLSLVTVTASEKVENVTCYDAKNGYVDITPLTGVAPFSYAFNGSTTFDDKTHYEGLIGSVAGTTYTYIVKDAQGCTANYSFKVFQPEAIVANASITAPYTCIGNATITASATKGNGGFTFVLKNTTTNTTITSNNTGLFPDLTIPGVYEVTVTDRKGCSTTVPAGTIVALNPPKGMTIQNSAVTCPTNTATVTITNVVNEANVAVPTAGLEYRIKAPTATAFQSSNTFTGLAAGVIYTFEVRDANKCLYEKVHEIKALPVFAVSVKSKTDITCSGAIDGTAIFTVSGLGNVVRYSYQVDALAPVTALTSPAAGSSFDISVTGLSAGNHKITVTNTDTGCHEEQTVVIDAPTATLSLNPEIVTDVTCDHKGTATIQAVGGWGSFTYTVTPKVPAGPAITKTTSLFSDLNAGTYDVLVKDLNGCEVTGDFVIGTVNPPTASIDTTTDLCAGTAGATIVVTPTNEPNYTYSLNGGTEKTTGTFTGLVPGEYIVTVKDITTGCSIDLTKQVVAEPVVVTDHKITKKLDCSTSEDAVIEVTIGSGYPDYRYRVNVNGAGFPATYTALGTGVTTFTYPASVAGSYEFEILDSKGCKTSFTENVATKVTPDFTTNIVDVKCFGDSTGKITVNATPTSGTYEYSKDNGNNWQSSNEFAGLAASSYDIVVRDTNTKCFFGKSISVNGPSAKFEADAEVTTDLKCGANNASQAAVITVTASGGTPYSGTNKYRYTYDTGNPATSISLSNSNKFTINASGVVNITVTDANGCTVETSATVAPLTPPTAIAFSAPAITCEATKLTSDLLVIVTGGKLPLKYEITSYVAAVAPAVTVTTQNSNTYTFAGLASGTYNFTITDDNGCTKTGSTVIDPVTPISESGKIDANVSCRDLADGRLIFTVSGNTNGTTGYAYSLVGLVTGTITTGVSKTGDVITYSGLSADSYTFTVTNNLTKCEAHETIVLANPTAVTIVSAIGPKVFCDRNNTTITVTANGGTGTLYYAVVKAGSTEPVYPTDYTTSRTFPKNTLVDGEDYDVYVRDSKGCPAQTTAHIVRDVRPTVNPIAVAPCYSGSNITITMSGTVFAGSGILYGIDGNYSADANKTITGPGTYKLTVKDDNGCISDPFDLVITDQLKLTVTPIKDVTCTVIPPFTKVDAKVTLSAVGGDNTYVYEVKEGATGSYTPIVPAGNVFETTAPGSYYFRVTSAGCLAESTAPFVVTNPTKPTAKADVTNLSCYQSADGTVTIIPTAGVAPFRFSFNGGTLTDNPTFSNLAASSPLGYPYTITDAKGCTSDVAYAIVTEPAQIQFTYTTVDMLCPGPSLGSITVSTVSNGVGPFTYELRNAVTGSIIVTGQDGITPYTFQNLSYGDFVLTVSDVNGCSNFRDDVKIVAPPNELDIDLSTPIVTCADGATVIVEVKPLVIPATPLYEFGIYNLPTAPFSTDLLPPDPGFPMRHTFTGLTPGVTYTFVVYDPTTNCYYFEKAAGPIDPLTSLTSVATTIPVACKGTKTGGVSISLSGTTATQVNYEIFVDQSDVSTGISGVIPMTTAFPFKVLGLSPGTYYVKFTEVDGSALGCTSSSLPFVVTESAVDLTVTARSPKNDNCKNNAGQIVATPNGGTGPFKYIVNQSAVPPLVTDAWGADNENVFNVEEGSYHVWVKDAYDCIKSTTVDVLLDDSPVINNLHIVDNCAVEGKFEVTVSMTTEGIAPYYISVNGGDWIEIKDAVPFPYTIKDLSSGPVNVKVKDFNDCEDADAITIIETPKASAQVTKQLDCSVSGNAVANATITVKIEKGTLPYALYEVKKGTAGAYTAITPVTNTVAGVTTFTYTVTEGNADVYQFRITDANSCKIETLAVTVDAIVPIVPDFIATQGACNGDNGTIVLSATGGKGPYTYKFDTATTFSETTTFSVPAGTYAFVVKDDLGCEQAGTAILGEPTKVTAGLPNVTPLSCGAGNLPQSATVILSATGGAGNYTYSFNNSGWTSDPKFIVADKNGADQLGIPFAVMDENGCMDTGTVDIHRLTPPTGFDFDPYDAITCTEATTTVTISGVTGGSGAITYQIISPTLVDNGNSPVFAGLLPDVEYVFQVTDENKCTFTRNLKIANVVNIDVIEQSITGITCASATDGKATFYVSKYDTGAKTYRYEVDGVAVPGNHSDPVINLINLTAGAHTIEVFDNETECPKLLNFTITAPPAALVLAAPVVTPLGCTTFGEVTLTATGGWGDYTFTLTQPDNTQVTNTTGVFKNLTQPGMYDIEVTDANNCTDKVTDSFELLVAPIPTLDIATTSDYCYYNTNSTTLEITASTTSTFPVTFMYSIDNGETWHTSNRFDKLTPKTYLIRVRDNYGCESATTTTVIKPQLFASVKSTKEIFCNNVDGSIRISAIGGYPDYSYTVAINGAAASGKIPFGAGFSYADYPVDSATPGSYVFTVYDAHDCAYPIEAIEMTPPTQVQYTATPTSPYCAGGQGNMANGTILFELAPGSNNPKYYYSIQLTSVPGSPLITQETPLFTGLVAGTYAVNVTSGRNCDAPDTVVINSPSMVVATATPGSFTCATPQNTLNATVVTVAGSGGAGDYLYSQDGVNWRKSNLFDVIDNETIQTLTYYVKDANGCIDSDQITVNPFPKLLPPTLSRVTQIACNNAGEVINVVINGGSTPHNFEYQVSVDGGAFGLPTIPVTGNSFQYPAPAAGHFYQFQITDKNTHCSIISTAYEVPVYNIAKVVASASADVTCNGLSNGEITINIIDYKGPYTYKVFNNNVEITAAAGSANSATTNPFVIPYGFNASDRYTVEITETAYPFCTVTSNEFKIVQPPVLDLSNLIVAVKNQNCNNKGAELTIDETQIVGGVGGYMYAFVPAGTVPTDAEYQTLKSKVIATTKIAPLFDAIDVYVKDRNGCPKFVTVHISVDPLPTITRVEVASQCASTTGYRIDVVANGVGQLKYSLDGKQFQTDNYFIVNTPGNYTVTVQDENQCTTTATTPVHILDPLTLSAKITTLSTCFDANGIITLTAKGGTVSTPSYLYTIDNWTTPTTDPVFRDLAPGKYTFKVRDIATGCEAEVKEEIFIPTRITQAVAKGTNVSCNGYADGKITVTIGASNDNPIYTYQLSGPVTRPAQESPVFNNLPFGNYVVTVTSGRGCTATATAVVGQPPVILVERPLVTQYVCAVGENNAGNATITVAPGSVQGGSGTYIRYQFMRDNVEVQNDERNTYTEYDYLGGEYIVNVFDSNGCQGSYASVTIDPYIGIADLKIDVTPINCRDKETVQVTAIATTGTLPTLSYTIEGMDGTAFPLTTSPTGLFGGLIVGNYKIIVTNTVTGCSIVRYHTVNEPNTFKFVASNIKNITCYADSDGEITLTLVDNIIPDDDAGVFTYRITHVESGDVINDVSTSTSINLKGLRRGEYTVVATLNGRPFCEVTTKFSIQGPNAALEITVSKEEITCAAGSKDGEIVATATGGWDGEYLYKLDGPVSAVYSTNNHFTDLTPGVYTVTVKDVNGCEDSETVTLRVPDPIAVNISATPMLTCFDNENGIVTINTVTGGSGNYTYTLHGVLVDGTVVTAQSQGATQFTDLKAGTYYVTVNDTWNCTNDSDKVVINQPEIVNATLEIVTTETCEVLPVIRLRATGGQGPYMYSADGINFTGPFASEVSIQLPATTARTEYKYFVKDVNDCRSFVSNTTEFFPVPELGFEKSSEIDIKCKGGATGSITVVAKGGLGNYIYTLQDAAGNDIVPAPAQVIPGVFTELPIGTYIVKVTSSDCETVSTTFVLTEPDTSLTADAIATPLTCNGYNNGKITVNAEGGVGEYKYAIEPEFKQFFDKNVFENLKPGFYDILVQDENNCYVFIKDVEVKEPDPIVIGEIIASREEEHCAGEKDGVFEIEVVGGTMPYSYSLDNQNGPFTLGDPTQTKFRFDNLEGKTHVVYILDANNCSQEITIDMAPPVTLDPRVEVTYDCVNNAQANMVVVTIDPSNTDPTQVTYSLDNDGTFQTSNIFTNVAAGPHFMVVKHTNGCEVTTELFEVAAVDPVSVIDVTNQSKDINTIVVKASGGVAPYEYSFNGEPFTSSNNYRIYKTGDYVVIVRDKNGCEATITVHGTFYDFCLPNYFTPNGDGQNDTIGPDCGALAYKELTFDIYDRYGRVVAKYHVGQKWDGRYHGNELPTGDYWYVLKLNDPKDPREFVGHFTLYR